MLFFETGVTHLLGRKYQNRCCVGITEIWYTFSFYVCVCVREREREKEREREREHSIYHKPLFLILRSIFKFSPKFKDFFFLF